MSTGPARRLLVASLAVVSAASLGGCVYAEAASTPPTPVSAVASSAPTATPGPSTVHDEQDLAFVQAAVEHYELTGRLAALMLAESRAEASHVDLARTLASQQGDQVARLQALLTAWGYDASRPARRVDGLAAVGAAEQSLALLEEQRDSAGFAPFWLLTVAEHQQGLLALARRTAEVGTSPEARREAAAFVRDYAGLDARLTDLGA